MIQRNTPYPPPFADSERTAVLERDLYHLDSRLTDLTSTVEAAHNRLFALSERIKRAEWQLDATTSSLQKLQEHTTDISDKMPDIESLTKVLKWLLEALKYILGLAILAGAFAGGQGAELLKALFG